MNGVHAPERPASMDEVLSCSAFQAELRRIARFWPGSTAGNPLDDVVKRIEANPAFTQSRLLTRVLTALTHQRGEFRRAEIAAFDAGTLVMIIALIDAYEAGTSTREQWLNAVDMALAAESGTSD